MPRIVSWLDVCNVEIHQGVDGWPGAHLIFNNLPYWYFKGLLYKTTGIESATQRLNLTDPIGQFTNGRQLEHTYEYQGLSVSQTKPSRPIDILTEHKS